MSLVILNRARHVFQHGHKPEMERYLRRFAAPTDDDMEALAGALAALNASVEETGVWLILTYRPQPRARELTWEKIDHRHWQAAARGMVFFIRGKGNHYHATRVLHGHETLLAVKPSFTLAAESALADLRA